ncbi:Fic family protein [Myceligenerans halotolerans]
MTLTRGAFFDRIAISDHLTPDYADDVLVRIAHHSSAIEGNSLTVSDTITLLVDEIAPSGGKSMRELYEVANHREALASVVEHSASGERLSGTFIRALHGDLLDHIRDDHGQWKTTQNAILGSRVETAEPADVPWLMEQWAENAQWQAENLKGSEAIEAIASAHADFERIHPFADGNGRTGRMLVMWQTLTAFGLPVIIEVDLREQYIAALDTDDRPALARLLGNCLLDERERARKFGVNAARSEARKP